MAYSEQNLPETDSSRRAIFIVIGLATALLVAGLFYLATRPRANDPAAGPPRLDGAVRAGSPEFEQYRERIVVDGLDATEATRAVGDVQMVVTATIRNFTGRTITGLEMRGKVVDPDNNPVRERVFIPLPSQRQQELEPNRTTQARVVLEGISKDDVRANIGMEVEAVRFK